MRRLSACAAAAAALSLAVSIASCEKGPPQYTLRQAMIEIDYADKRLMKELGDPAAALEDVRTIERWFTDPAMDRHLRREVDPAKRALFGEMRADFAEHLRQAKAAAEAGDAGRLRGAYMRMRMRCDVCHNEFRPGLVLGR